MMPMHSEPSTPTGPPPRISSTDLDAKKRKATEKAKAAHLLRQLQLRLQYARLKVDHGWQRQNLNEVENLYFRRSHMNSPQRLSRLRPTVAASPMQGGHAQLTSAPATAQSETDFDVNMDSASGNAEAPSSLLPPEKKLHHSTSTAADFSSIMANKSPQLDRRADPFSAEGSRTVYATSFSIYDASLAQREVPPTPSPSKKRKRTPPSKGKSYLSSSTGERVHKQANWSTNLLTPTSPSPSPVPLYMQSRMRMSNSDELGFSEAASALDPTFNTFTPLRRSKKPQNKTPMSVGTPSSPSPSNGHPMHIYSTPSLSPSPVRQRRTPHAQTLNRPQPTSLHTPTTSPYSPMTYDSFWSSHASNSQPERSLDSTSSADSLTSTKTN